MKRLLLALVVTTVAPVLLLARRPEPARQGGSRAPEIGAAIKEFLLTLTDSTPISRCRHIQIHPEVGDSFYTLVVRRHLAWHVRYRLPVKAGEVLRRGGREIVFTPPVLDRPSLACLGYAATAASRYATPDSIALFVEVLNRGRRGLYHAFTLSAVGVREDGRWRFVKTGEGD